MVDVIVINRTSDPGRKSSESDTLAGSEHVENEKLPDWLNEKEPTSPEKFREIIKDFPKEAPSWVNKSKSKST